MCLYSSDDIPSTAASIAVKSYAVAVMLFQWVTCFLIILTGFQSFSVICFIILGIGIALFLAFWFKFDTMSKILITVESESEKLVDVPYVHPLDVSVP